MLLCSRLWHKMRFGARGDRESPKAQTGHCTGLWDMGMASALPYKLCDLEAALLSSHTFELAFYLLCLPALLISSYKTHSSAHRPGTGHARLTWAARGDS